MKSNKTLYFLLPAVLVVWGLIAYRFFDLTREEVVEVSPIYIKSTDKLSLVIETRELILDYPDPFIKNSTTSKIPSILAKRENQKVDYEDPYKDWASIRYSGLIRNSNRNSQVAIIDIESERYLLELNEDVLGYQLTSLNKDSMQLVFRDRSRWIRVE